MGDDVALAVPGAEEGAGVAVYALDDGVDGCGFAEGFDAELPGGFTLGALYCDLPVAFDAGGSGDGCGGGCCGAGGEDDGVAGGRCAEGSGEPAVVESGIEGAGEVVEGDEEVAVGKGGAGGGGLLGAVDEDGFEVGGRAGDIKVDGDLLVTDGGVALPCAGDGGLVLGEDSRRKQENSSEELHGGSVLLDVKGG